MPEPPDSASSKGEAEDPASPATDVRTVLIADIRGYTTFTRERGDEAAAALAARFAKITEEVVTARAGRLVELRGDEALVVFSSTRQALRAALELQAQFAAAELPRGVGIGLDAGEAVRVGDGYRGSALNLAARLCAIAGPGEVLASDAVVHLASKVEGIRYVTPRAVRVKGFADPVRTVRVVAATDEAPAERRARRLPSVGGRRLALLAAALVGAVATGVGLFTLGMDRPETGNSSPSPSSGSGAAPPFDGPGLAFIDPDTGEPTGARLPLGAAVEVEYVEGAFWVLAFGPAALHKVDAESHEVVATIPIPFSPGSWLVDGNTVWFTDYEEPILHKLDVVSGREVDAFRLSDEFTGLQGVAMGAGSLWVAIRDIDNGLLRVDPGTGEVVHSYPIFASHVVATDDVVWAGGWGYGSVHRIDPRTDAVTAEVAVTAPISGTILAAGYLWAANPEKGEVFKIDDRGTIVDTYAVPGTWYLGAGDGRVWAAGEEERTVDRIDILTGEVTTFDMPRSINDVAEGDGQVALALPRQMEEAVAGLSGEVLRIAMSDNPFDYLDAAIEGSLRHPVRDLVSQATCVKLLNYPDLPPPEGWRLEPEVAAAMPDVSADGLTYVFRIRPGYAFSPPSDEPITAETFRYSIERALSPDLGPNATAIEYITEVEGAEAFHRGDAPSVSGLRADGETLTVTLSEPSPTLLHDLARPAFCPVPLGSAAIVNGVSNPPLPRSGPYYIAEWLGGVVLVLEKNPNYPGPREAAFDAIVWRVLEESGPLIGQVERGELDLTLWGTELEPGGQVDLEWGAGSDAAAAGDQRHFTTPSLAVDAVALNPNDPLLADPRVRQAIGLAIDRAALAAPFSGTPITSLLTPAVPGTDETAHASLDPVLDRANELMAGRRGSVTVAACEFPGCQAWARSLADNLARIGITVDIRTVDDPFAVAADPSAGIGIINAFGDCNWCMVPDAALALEPLVASVPQGWLPAPILDEAVAVLGLAEPERTERAAALAERLAAGESLLLPFATYGPWFYFSERIGCQMQAVGAPGINLVALCLKGEP